MRVMDSRFRGNNGMTSTCRASTSPQPPLPPRNGRGSNKTRFLKSFSIGHTQSFMAHCVLIKKSVQKEFSHAHSLSQNKRNVAPTNTCVVDKRGQPADGAPSVQRRFADAVHAKRGKYRNFLHVRAKLSLRPEYVSRRPPQRAGSHAVDFAGRNYFRGAGRQGHQQIRHA